MNRRKSFAESAEELNEAWRVFILALCTSLGIDRLAAWLAEKLTKEDAE